MSEDELKKFEDLDKGMSFEKRVSDMMTRFSPLLGRISPREWIWIIFLSIIICFGLYALYTQIMEGHGVTGMRDNVVWGIYIVNFIFFIGLGYSGSVISALLYLSKVQWRGPIVRVSMIMMAISTIIGPIFILLCIGRLDRLHHLFLYPRLQSPIILGCDCCDHLSGWLFFILISRFDQETFQSMPGVISLILVTE